MPLVKDQPAREEDLAPSLLEINAAAVTSAQEWETEWNTTGLPSRLSQEVGWKLEGIPVKIVHAIKLSDITLSCIVHWLERGLSFSTSVLFCS